MSYHTDLEHKYAKLDIHAVKGDEIVIQGYASLFGQCDQGGDTVQKGAYAKSLARLDQDGRAVKMLWQHNPAEPIGVWDAVYEDDAGLFVKGRLLPTVSRAKEAAELLSADTWDGLDIPLGEESEQYHVRVLRSGQTVIELTTSSPKATISNAHITAHQLDIDAQAISIEVAQISNTYGPGVSAVLEVV